MAGISLCDVYRKEKPTVYTRAYSVREASWKLGDRHHIFPPFNCKDKYKKQVDLSCKDNYKKQVDLSRSIQEPREKGELERWHLTCSHLDLSI